MIVVLDASAALTAVLDAPGADAFMNSVSMDDEVVSPTLFHAEVANGMAKYVRAGRIDAKRAAMGAFTASEMVDRFFDVRDLYIEALGEGVRLNHPAYDMFYLVLARRMGGTLFTMDKALARLCIAEGVSCVCPGVTEEPA